MAVVEVHPVPIDGPWIEGFVLDRHVISSVPIGYLGEQMQFDTTRSARRCRRCRGASPKYSGKWALPRSERWR